MVLIVIFTIRLIVKGCGQGAYEEVIHTVVSSISTTWNLSPYNNKYVINNDCCEPGGRIVNESGEEYLFYQDYIIVDDGYHLATDEKAEHFAGNFIEILPETTIDQGADYKAEISMCDLGENKIDQNQGSSETTLLIRQQLHEPIRLVPNPAREAVFAVTPNQKIKQSRVFDQFGRLLDLPL